MLKMFANLIGATGGNGVIEDPGGGGSCTSAMYEYKCEITTACSSRSGKYKTGYTTTGALCTKEFLGCC